MRNAKDYLRIAQICEAQAARCGENRTRDILLSAAREWRMLAAGPSWEEGRESAAHPDEVASGPGVVIMDDERAQRRCTGTVVV